MTFPIEDYVGQFTLVVTCALVVMLVLERTRVPGIVGLLILGMVIGPDGFGILPQTSAVDFLGPVGLLYIMFVAGLEIDLDMVRAHPREAAHFGISAFVFSLSLATLLGLLLGLDMAGALLLGAALSSHTLVSYPMLNRMGFVGRRSIVAATGGTLLTDTAALVLLVIVIQFAGGEGDAGLFGAILPLALLLALVVGALVLVPALARRVFESSYAFLAQKTLFALAVLLVLSVIAEAIGTKDILGAFLAGICLNRVFHRFPDVRSHLEFVGRMLFVPFFFVETGTRLEFAVIFGAWQVWLIALALAVVIFITKTLAALWTARRFSYGRVDMLAMAGLSFPQAAATLAVIITGGELGLLSAEIVDAIIIVILITCLVGSVLTDYAARRIAKIA